SWGWWCGDGVEFRPSTSGQSMSAPAAPRGSVPRCPRRGAISGGGGRERHAAAPASGGGHPPARLLPRRGAGRPAPGRPGGALRAGVGGRGTREGVGVGLVGGGGLFFCWRIFPELVGAAPDTPPGGGTDADATAKRLGRVLGTAAWRAAADTMARSRDAPV